jgi:2-polyprenyl-3-methyl-5-hydroxy-6-metoxy-1,4-benzoquinol methylase/glycosyltransferase involved in cell wall biosynthesis
VKLLIFIVAYNAENTINSVLRRIPACLLEEHETEVLIIDDASADSTFETANHFKQTEQFPFRLTVLNNPVNQGYGGNQKLGFLYAIQNGFDAVALVHGDGQYAPEALPMLVSPIAEGKADAVFGSRMMTALGALKGGMPLYKYVGNRILTTFQNVVLHHHLSEYHSGYRIYSTEALKKIPFELNTSVFHFDTEIIIQLIFAGLRIKELSIPTYYGDEICHVNGLRYAWDVFVATIISRLQSLCLLYRARFDVQPVRVESIYEPKLEFDSPHTRAIAAVPPNVTVADLGCASGYLSTPLKKKGCTVIGVDQFDASEQGTFDRFVQHDLNDDRLPAEVGKADYVLMLDIIEHLASPERFLRTLAAHTKPDATIVISTPNIAFIVVRLMLLIGQFNYGKKGILDLTHTRLFTFDSLRAVLEGNGFRILSQKGVPAPVPLVVKNETLAQLLLKGNQLLIALSRGLFSYQIFTVVKPLPSLSWLLEQTTAHSRQRESMGRQSTSELQTASRG